MADDIAEIVAQMEEAAMDATPGQWIRQPLDDTDGPERGSAFIVAENLGGLVAAALPFPTEIDSGDFSRVQANARHIATSNPASVLSLIAAYKEAVRERDEAKARLEDMLADAEDRRFD